MITDAPFHTLGNTVVGAGLPTRGLPFAVGVRSIEAGSAQGARSLASLGAVAADSVRTEVYSDGAYVDVVDEFGLFSLPGLRPGVPVELGLLQTTLVEHLQATGVGQIFAARAMGNRACLAWSDEPTAADFAAFVLLWDEGEGGAADTELIRLASRTAREYRTAPLAAGDYQFALAYADAVGNLSSAGDTVTVAIAGIPAAVSGFSIDYDDGTRTATLTWTPPATDTADVRAYLVFDNWTPGSSSLGEFANSDTYLRRAESHALPGAGEQTWTSPELWAGLWRFDVRGLSAEGLVGESVELSLNLALNGSALEEVVAPPAKPILREVRPAASGRLVASFELPTETGLTAVWIVENGTQTAEVTLTGARFYTETSATHSDGLSIETRVRAYTSSTVYTESDPITETTDAAAPAADGVLTGEACY